jgi:hypothetical protein
MQFANLNQFGDLNQVQQAFRYTLFNRVDENALFSHTNKRRIMKAQIGMALLSLLSVMLISRDLSKQQCGRFVPQDLFDVEAFKTYWKY